MQEANTSRRAADERRPVLLHEKTVIVVFLRKLFTKPVLFAYHVTGGADAP
jgi:hypothetical protein